MNNQEKKIRGCLYGMAIGDGYGYPTEFLSIEEIVEKWPPNGPTAPEGNPILVTDDTQMALAVGNALVDTSKNDFDVEYLTQRFIFHYVKWLNDSKNNRAPGMTCIQSCERLEKGIDWQRATEHNSKGCGANMRVIPVGLLRARGVGQPEIAAIAQLQSAITHAHPTALAASEITAMTIVNLLEGNSLDTLVDALLIYCEEQKLTYYANYLHEIWDRPPFRMAEAFITLGWEQVIKKLELVKASIAKGNKEIDPCLMTGAGWIAEESFATALYCFLLYPENPQKALHRAVVTSGDSDSIACLTGAFVGVYCGEDAFPQDWLSRIEYKEELDELVDFYLNKK